MEDNSEDLKKLLDSMMESTDDFELNQQHLKQITLRAIENVINKAESAIIQATKCHEILINVVPNKHLDNPWVAFMDLFREKLVDSEKACKFAISVHDTHTDGIKAIVGLSSLVGHLFNRGLTDVDMVNKWLVDVLTDDFRYKFIKLNLMEIVKVKVKDLMDGGGDEKLKEVYKAIKSENLYDVEEDESPQIAMSYSQKIEKANDMIERVVHSPATMRTQVMLYKDLKNLDNEFETIFNQEMDARLINIENYYDLHINITWIESFKAELCINGMNNSEKFINELAERILYESRDKTLIFVIILHKLSKNLRREAPSTFNRCVGYLTQLIGSLPLPNGFWDANMRDLNDLKLNLYHKKLDKFTFVADEKSLERAKFIFIKALEEHEYIISVLYNMPNSLGMRLLKTHFSFLCKTKFITEEFELDLDNEHTPKNIKTKNMIRLVAALYDHDIINNYTIMSIFIQLVEQNNAAVLTIFSINVGKKVREDHDPLFALTRNEILEVYDEYEKTYGMNDLSSSKSAQNFNGFFLKLIKSQCSISDYDYKSLNSTSLKNCSNFIIEQTTNLNIADISSKVCIKIDEVQPKFKKILADLLEENFNSTFSKFGFKNFIVKFESKAQLIGSLTKEKFLDPSLISKYSQKSREILTKIKSEESWKSFLKVFNNVSQSSVWYVSIEGTFEFVTTMDFFYEIVESNSQPSIVNMLSKILNDLNDQVKPNINAANANPSFKNAVHGILKRTDEMRNSYTFNLNALKINSPIYVLNPVECAKYYVINAISCEKSNNELFTFLYLFVTGKCADYKYVELFKEQGQKLLPEMINFIVKLIQEHHSNRRGYKPEVSGKTIKLASFTAAMFLHGLMNSDIFKKCFNTIANSFSIEENETNRKCLMDMVFIIKDCENFNEDPVYQQMLIHIINSLATRKGIKNIIEVGEKPLTFSEIKAQKGECHAQMITDSVVKMNDSTPMIFSTYYDYCSHIQKFRPKFKKELELRIVEITVKLIYLPYPYNFKWDQITKFGLFLSCLYTHDFIDYGPIEGFTDFLSRKYIDYNRDTLDLLAMKNFTRYYHEIGKRYPKTLKEQNIVNVDMIWLYSHEVDEENKKLATDLIKFFDKTLMFDEVNEYVWPSFKYFMDNVIKGCEYHEWQVIVAADSEESAKFFMKYAILYPYTRLSALIRHLRIYETGQDLKTKGSVRFLVPDLVKLCKVRFNEEFGVNNVTNAKHPIGITKFIAEFFMNGFLPQEDFNFYVEKICEVTLAKPTMCNIMCFHNLVIATGNRIEKHPKAAEIKRAKEFVEKRTKSSELEFSDDILDTIDYEKIVEVVPMQGGNKTSACKFFIIFIKRLIEEKCTLKDFDYRQIHRDYLKQYSQIIIEELEDLKTISKLSYQLCSKIQAVHPKFKKVFYEQLESEIEKSSNATLAHGGHASALLNGKFMDSKLVVKALNKLKSNVKWFVTILIDASKSLEAEDVASYLQFADFLYKDISPANKKTIESFFELFFKNLIVEDSKEGKIVPSFKYAVNSVIIDKSFNHYFCMEEPKACAKFLFNNISKSTGKNNEFMNFLVRIAKVKSLIENPVVPEVVRLTKIAIEEIFLNRRENESFDKTTNLCSFAVSCFLNKLMSIDHMVRCVDVMMDAMAFKPNNTTSNCLSYIRTSTFKELEKNADKGFLTRFSMTEDAFKGFDERKLKVVHVSGLPLEFAEIKSKKIDISAQMIVDSVLKMNNPSNEVLRTYTRFCCHIQKYKSLFVDSIEKKFNEQIVTLVMAPLLENFKWKAIENFGNFLACLDEQFKTAKEANNLTPFLRALELRYKKVEEISPENFISLINFYYSISLNHKDLLMRKNIWMLEMINRMNENPKFETTECSCALLRLSNEFDGFLAHDDTDASSFISQSFKLYMHYICNERDVSDFEVSIPELTYHSGFFVSVMTADNEATLSLCVNKMVEWKNKRPGDFKFKPHTEAEFFQAVFIDFKLYFTDNFFGGTWRSQKSKAILACRIASELYIHNILNSTDFGDYMDKIIELVRAKPTCFALLCYQKLVMTAIFSIMTRNDEEIMNRWKIVQDEFAPMLESSEFNYDDDDFDSIDCERIVKPVRSVNGPTTSRALNGGRNFDREEELSTSFYKPHPKSSQPLAIKFNPHNSQEFREFFNNLTPDANLDNFQCSKINQKLMVEYSQLLVAKVNENKNFTRVVADICEVILKKNRDFILVIAEESKKEYSKLLDGKKLIWGFLEFYTMLNKKCGSKASDDLTKFALFEALEKNWIKYDEQIFAVMMHFILLNKKVIENMPKYVAGDIFHYLKIADEEDYKMYNPKYDMMDFDELANPSLKYAVNLCVSKYVEDFWDYFDDPKDIRIINPVDCAKFFVVNATKCGRPDRFYQIMFAKLLKFIVSNSPNDKNVKTFHENILKIVKERKLDDKVKDEVVKGTSAFIIELHEHHLMDDTKPKKKSNKKSKKKNKKVVEEVENVKPTNESEAEIIQEIKSPFDVDAFKLILIDAKSNTFNQLNDKIKSIKIESEKCLLAMAREFMNGENSSKVAEMINENFPGFKEVLEREIVKELRLMLKNEIFDRSEVLEILNSQEMDKSNKEILQNFNIEVVKVEKLLNFATDLFNIGWISLDNLQNLLEFFIVNRNFEMASKILKKTSLKLSQSAQVLKFKSELDYITPRSISEFYHCVNVIEQLDVIQKSAERHFRLN